jgi:copper(I)-binding protein
MYDFWRGSGRVLFGVAVALAVAPAAGVPVFGVTEPWVLVAPDGRSGEAYMQLRSSEGEAIVGVRSEDASEVTMLASGKARLGVGTLAKPLKLGDRVRSTLVVEGAGCTTREIPVNAEVRRRSPTDDHAGTHKHSRARSSGAVA